MRIVSFPLSFFTLAAVPAYGQEGNPNPPPTGGASIGHSYLNKSEIVMSFGVLAFGLFMTCAAIFLLRTALVPSVEVIRLVALLLIVSGVLFLVAAGYDAQSISPALGLLGTVAGYLLGRSDRGSVEVQKAADPAG
jgi:hypothetical protein